MPRSSAVEVVGEGSTQDPDRRRAPRVPCYVGARLRTVESRDAILSYAVELSETGVLIRTLRSFPPGTRVEIALSPTPSPTDVRAITVHGEVVRSTVPAGPREAHNLGIRFDESPVVGNLLRELAATAA